MKVQLGFPKMSHRPQALLVPVTWILVCIETLLETALKDRLPWISCPFPSPFCKLLWANRQCCWQRRWKINVVEVQKGGTKRQLEGETLLKAGHHRDHFSIGLTFFLCISCFETQSNKQHRGSTLPTIHASYLIGLVKITCLNDRLSRNSAVYFTFFSQSGANWKPVVWLSAVFPRLPRAAVQLACEFWLVHWIVLCVGDWLERSSGLKQPWWGGWGERDGLIETENPRKKSPKTAIN